MIAKFKKTVFAVVLLCLMSMNVAMAANEEVATVEGMQGISPPKETVVTVNGTYSANYGKNSIDGKLGTLWNSGATKEQFNMFSRGIKS